MRHKRVRKVHKTTLKVKLLSARNHKETSLLDDINVETTTPKQKNTNKIKPKSTIHPHSSKSELVKLSGVTGCRDGGKSGRCRKVGGNSQSCVLSGLSCAVSCDWARFLSQEAKMLLASPVGILLCTVFTSSCLSASTEMLITNVSLQKPADGLEIKS